MDDRAKPLAEGKLPAALLARLLGGIAHGDATVLVPPAPGRDVAVVDPDPAGDRLWVLTADPITFATRDAGALAVTVNTNDIATAGAMPRYLLATILLPPETPAEQAEALAADVDGACRAQGIALVGGHTEVTSAVTRPVVSAALIGEVSRAGLVRSDGARVGDVVLCTEGVPLEGACILAREYRPSLRAAGVPAETIEEAAAYARKPGLSVLRAARVACSAASVHAMHDPTEGGIATALHEVADASGLDLEVDAEALPVLPAAAAICRALGLDPLGLIASGALLMAVDPADVEAVCQALGSEGIASARVATLAPSGTGRRLFGAGGVETPLPRFDQDELARVPAPE